MTHFFLTLACGILLAQPPVPAPAGIPELKAGALVRITTRHETLTGIVEPGGSDGFLRLRVAGTTTPTYVSLAAIETIRVLPAVPVGAREAAPAGPDPNRHLVYVHGICRHRAGFSKPWWQAMKPFTPQILEGNVHEVVWSDAVNPALAAAPGEGGPQKVDAAPQLRTEEQRRLAESLQAVLRDRAEQEAAEGGAGYDLPRAGAPAEVPDKLATADLVGGLLTPFECANDFVLYMTDSAIRERVLARFDAVVRPLLETGADVEIISHSWGTVVSYEGLRRLAAAALPARGRIHNLFTVGSALSIWQVRVNLAGRFPGGEKPRQVARWVNLDARFDIVGGRIQGDQFAVDVERLSLAPLGCSFPVTPICAHGSYFSASNLVVNRDIFGFFIGQ